MGHIVAHRAGAFVALLRVATSHWNASLVPVSIASRIVQLLL